MSGSAGDPLALTARWTAAARAMEAARADRLFDDPWAHELAGAVGQAWLGTRSPESVLPIVLRTRYFDDWLGDLTRARAIDQVVILGAGLDTRAYRLSWPDGLIVYELDREAVLRHKEAVLVGAGAVARCTRRIVAADLTSDWSAALLAAGFDPAHATAWLLEGLLFYLDASTGARLVDTLTDLSASRSRLAFDIVNGAVLTSPWTRPWVEMQAAAGAPWVGTMEDPIAFLAQRGWQAGLTQAGQPDVDHGRWTLPVLPLTQPDIPHSWLVTAVRGEAS